MKTAESGRNNAHAGMGYLSEVIARRRLSTSEDADLNCRSEVSMIDFTLDNFLLEVYTWLLLPCNEELVNKHDRWSSFMSTYEFIAEMEKFMDERFRATHPNEKVNKNFIHRCACEYARGF